MKILIDMNLSPDWVSDLRDHVSEVVHWTSLGAGNAPDDSIALHARREGFIILTQILISAHSSFSGERMPSVLMLRAGRVAPALFRNQVLLSKRTYFRCPGHD